MRWLLNCVCAVAMAQTVEVLPVAPRQGETLHVRATVADAQSARMGDRTVRLFEGSGLFPIPVEQKPGGYRLEILDGKGGVFESAAITVRDAHYPVQNIVLGKAVAELKPSPGEMETTEAFRNTVSDTRYWTEPLRIPVSACMTSLFGVRRFQNGKPTGSFHGGVDLRGAAGAPVHAAADGVVKIARQFNLHGGTVGLDHGQGLESMYLHLSKFAVAEGAKVKQGEVIGYVGSTGRATGPHLHWSLYVDGVPVNPGQWVALQACSAPARPRPKKPQ